MSVLTFLAAPAHPPSSWTLGRALPHGFQCLRRRLRFTNRYMGQRTSLSRPLPAAWQACLPLEETGVGFALADLPVVQLQDAPDLPGAYAVRDADGRLMYLGYSRSVSSMLDFHRGRVGPLRAATCQFYAPQDRDVGPDLLESVLEYWVRENEGAVPPGNLADRMLWEGPSAASAPATPQEEAERNKEKVNSVPYRARKTAKRVAANRRTPFSSSAFRSRRNSQRELEDDYVFVDVDPLDPFSPGRSKDAPKWSSSPFQDDDETADDWMPLAAIVGIASVVWFLGVLGHTVPTAAPSLGM